MPTLPRPGDGPGWGHKLNAWLRVAHNDDGSLRQAPGVGGLALRATTGGAGYRLITNTGAIMGWAVPGDGALHRVLIWGTLEVAAPGAGGTVTISFTPPGGGAAAVTLLGPSQPRGLQVPDPSSYMLAVKPGTTVSLTQSVPLAGGAAVLYADIWGA